MEGGKANWVICKQKAAPGMTTAQKYPLKKGITAKAQTLGFASQPCVSHASVKFAGMYKT
jgi:hypothetical protein